MTNAPALSAAIVAVPNAAPMSRAFESSVEQQPLAQKSTNALLTSFNASEAQPIWFLVTNSLGRFGFDPVLKVVSREPVLVAPAEAACVPG